MANYLSAEEEYELMYGEELEMMDDFDEPENKVNKPPFAPKNDTILASPALSQISKDEKLKFTPAVDRMKNHKKTSTPFLEKLKQVEAKENSAPENYDALSEIQNIGVKRKRKLEDLFGDIYDLENEGDDIFTKKHKTDEEKDFETIAKIVEARKHFELQFNPSRKTNLDRYEFLHKFKRENLSTIIPKYPFISFSKNDERIYVRYHSEDFEKLKMDEIKAYDNKKETFFGGQSAKLWQDANDIMMKNIENTSQMNEMLQLHENTNFNPNVRNDLWVDKYSPRKYIELLSDESINRSLLQWMKLWDKVVFNKEVAAKTSKAGELSNFNKKTGKFEQNGGWQRRNKLRGHLNTDLDGNNVPIQKIALLVGKPGLGKTTLANIIAKHAGYEVREVNASDDRQVDSFKQVLENCTQMTSVLNRENRPNCIILDEIDGAPVQSIDYLVRFVSGQIAEKSKKGKNSKKIILKRPIICICNDLYGANLRQLRQIAYVVNFQSIDNARLAERLMHISHKERVKTDLTTMLALAEKTSGDIRSCVSVIQFFSSLKKPLTLIDVLKSNVGHKDQHKSLFNVWSSIFQIQRPKKIIKESETNQEKQIVGMSDTSIKTRMQNVLEVVNSCGEYEKLAQGVFENYLKQKFQDINMERVVEGVKWFIFNDSIQHKINHLQNYIIYPYLQFGFISWHFCFSSMAFPQITYPQKQYDVLQKHNMTKQIFDSFKKGIATNVHGIGSRNEILVDTMSLLKHIIYPEVRSVSMHLLTEKEKNELQHTVKIIADFGLTLVQYQTNDGTYTYRMEPDIDHFNFTGMMNKQISYWSKQIIAKEVEVEKIRRARPKLDDVENDLSKSNAKKQSQNIENKTLPNHLQKLIPKVINQSSVKPSQLVCKDFFGRVITKPSVNSSASGSSTQKNDSTPGTTDNFVFVKSPVWLKFKEGFNNAVRTDVKMSDLL